MGQEPPTATAFALGFRKSGTYFPTRPYEPTVEYLEHRVAMVNDRLEEVASAVGPSELADQLDHVALAGGKRVRPAVTILACETVGGTPEDAVDFAVGVELVHNTLFVVDDIIDRSDIRRGTPSAWAKYGYGPVIIASDGLLGEASALLSSSDRATRIVAESIVELGEGEATELVAVPSDETEYMQLAHRKTGALFRAAAELGAVTASGGAHAVEAFDDYATHVGVAFQIHDDVLNATVDAEELGKPTGQDAEMGRSSLVQVTDLTPEEANHRACRQADEALSALDDSGVDDSESLEYLRDLAGFVIAREN